MSDPGKPWEPDSRKMGNWTEMFDGPSRGAPEPVPPGSSAEPYDDLTLNAREEYKPWSLQRGRSRPVMMVEFRRHEPRSGLWTCWALTYASLVSLEYTGDQLLSLAFGTCVVIVHGRGLDALARHVEEGAVMAVHEHAPSLWAAPSHGPTVSRIERIFGDA